MGANPDTAADRAAIIRLTHDYAFYNDTFAVDQLIELFVEDGRFDMRPAGFGLYAGTPAIRGYFEGERKAMSHLMHVTTNHRIDLGEPSTARGTVYYVATGVRRRSGRRVLYRGYYADQYVRGAAGWRFAERRSEPLMPAEQAVPPV